jgi:hypothetical protein
MHITSEGWVEPCIFTHFATDNIRDMSLLEAFNSPFFREIRNRQPFNENLLMPCMWIDNPNCSREIMACTGARPTHDGADSMLVDLQKEMDEYSLEATRVFNPIWSCLSETTQADTGSVADAEAAADADSGAEAVADLEPVTDADAVADLEPGPEADPFTADVEPGAERADDRLAPVGH